MVRMRVVFPAPLIPTIPKRSPGPIFHVNSLMSSLSPAVIFACWYSKTVRPRRLSANLSNSDLSRGAGSLLINSLAASTRNFGFTVCAGAPRRSQASSLRISWLRRASIALVWRARSAFARTYAEYPPSYSSSDPPTTSHVRSVTASRNQRSCVTTKTAKSLLAFKCWASQSTPSTSRWFVGSSSIMRSSSSISSFAKPTLRFSPPDSVTKTLSKR